MYFELPFKLFDEIGIFDIFSDISKDLHDSFYGCFNESLEIEGGSLLNLINLSENEEETHKSEDTSNYSGDLWKGIISDDDIKDR